MKGKRTGTCVSATMRGNEVMSTIQRNHGKFFYGFCGDPQTHKEDLY